MPEIKFKHFDKYREQGILKGVFLGGCVERGDGSSFRARAHTHIEDQWKGWICVRGRKRLMTRTGKPSNLMWHELAHAITGQGHTDVFRAKLRELGGRCTLNAKKRKRSTRETWFKKQLRRMHQDG
jgi:hypothetical protein